MTFQSEGPAEKSPFMISAEAGAARARARAAADTTARKGFMGAPPVGGQPTASRDAVRMKSNPTPGGPRVNQKRSSGGRNPLPPESGSRASGANSAPRPAVG